MLNIEKKIIIISIGTVYRCLIFVKKMYSFTFPFYYLINNRIRCLFYTYLNRPLKTLKSYIYYFIKEK